LPSPQPAGVGRFAFPGRALRPVPRAPEHPSAGRGTERHGKTNGWPDGGATQRQQAASDGAAGRMRDALQASHPKARADEGHSPVNLRTCPSARMPSSSCRVSAYPAALCPSILPCLPSVYSPDQCKPLRQQAASAESIEDILESFICSAPLVGARA
jgi:hypothetical protein